MEVSSEEFGTMLEDFKRSAFRMETHQVYTMPREQPNLARFMAGEPKPEDHNNHWHELIRNNLAAGKTMQRLKMVRRPFTDYTRYLMSWGVVGNVGAGEDYRILDITDRTIDIPEQDYWMFDEETVLLLNFNPDGTLRNRELADPADLDKYLHWRDVALPEAVPFLEYQYRP